MAFYFGASAFFASKVLPKSCRSFSSNARYGFASAFISYKIPSIFSMQSAAISFGTFSAASAAPPSLPSLTSFSMPSNSWALPSNALSFLACTALILSSASLYLISNCILARSCKH